MDETLTEVLGDVLKALWQDTGQLLGLMSVRVCLDEGGERFLGRGARE